MSADSVIIQGRALLESMMTTTGTIKRQTGTITDPDTLVEAPVYGMTIYSGKCRVKFPKDQPADGDIPGAVVVQQSPELHIPVSAVGSADVAVGDVWTCTASPLDAGMVGVQLRIAGVHYGTYMTARRFPVEAVN